MDSGNSGSIQSSSGGDEEYNPPQPPPHHHHQQQQQQQQQKHSSCSLMFDPLSNIFYPLSRSAQPPPLANQNSLLNLDTVLSKPQRSEPDLGGVFTPTQQSLADQLQGRVSFQIPQRPDNIMVIRNQKKKKRPRVSKRAPTTVLTTDTTNFRAMVQEFTGIPAPPFTPPPPPPPYLLKPFAQKPQPPLLLTHSFLSPSTTTELTDNNNINSSTNSPPSNSTSNINYQLLNNINMQLQNPGLDLQSLILNQVPPKYNPLADSIVLEAKQRGSLQVKGSDDDFSHHKIGVLEEFGLSYTTTSHHRGLQNINVSSSSDTSLPPIRDTSNWGGDGVGSSEGDHHQHHQDFLRSISGNYNDPERVVNSNGKVNYSGSGLGSSDFRGDKGTENLSTRATEGMVESWIFSSE